MLQDGFFGAGEGGRVFKGPGEALSPAWEDGAAFSGFFVADGDHGIVLAPLPEEIEDCLGRFARQVNAYLLHDGDDMGIEGAGLQAGAFGLEGVAAVFFQEGFGHLAAGRIVDTDEENFVFAIHGRYINIAILRWFGSKKRLGLTAAVVASLVGSEEGAKFLLVGGPGLRVDAIAYAGALDGALDQAGIL